VVRLLLVSQQCRRTDVKTAVVSRSEAADAEPSEKEERLQSAVPTDTGRQEGMPDLVKQQVPIHAGSMPQLDWDSLRDIIALAAYPISAWM